MNDILNFTPVRQILIDKELFFEETNKVLELIPDRQILEKYIVANSQFDVDERKHIINWCNKLLIYLNADKNTRRASSCNDFNNDLNNCISYFHFYIRNNQLNLYIYQRSCNLETNINYDMQTWNKMFFEVYDKLSYKDVKIGDIRVDIFSLHKKIKTIK